MATDLHSTNDTISANRPAFFGVEAPRKDVDPTSLAGFTVLGMGDKPFKDIGDTGLIEEAYAVLMLFDYERPVESARAVDAARSLLALHLYGMAEAA